MTDQTTPEGQETENLSADGPLDEVDVVNEKSAEADEATAPQLSGFAQWHERISTEPIELSPELTAKLTSGRGIATGIFVIFGALVLLRGLQLFFS